MERINAEKMYNFTEIGRNGWLGVGPAGVYNLIREGKLTAIIVGTGKKNKRYAIQGIEVIKYLANPNNKYQPIKKL